MVAEAAAPFPALAVRVTSAFGVHEKLGELILGRAGLPVANPLTSEEATRCWHCSQSGRRLRRRLPLPPRGRVRRDHADRRRRRLTAHHLNRTGPCPSSAQPSFVPR